MGQDQKRILMRMAHLEFRGRHQAVAHFNQVLWRRVGDVDRRRIQQVITDTRYGAKELDGRSLVHVLEEPIPFRRSAILSLRFKGIAPDLKRDGAIPEHRGGGYVAHPTLVREDGTAYPKASNRGSPEGGIRARNAQEEFANAVAVGRDLTDIAFGHGTYPELQYHGENLGFVIYGMETEADLRFWRDFVRPRIDNLKYGYPCGPYSIMIDTKLIALTKLFGEAFAKFHGQGLIHRFPHLGNIGVIQKDETPIQVKIRDLTDCLKVSDLTPAQAYGYLALDLARVMDDICGNNKADNGEEFIDINFADLLPHFLDAYFDAAPRFPITSGVNDHLHYGFFISPEDRTIGFLRHIMEQIRDKGTEFNLPQEFSESPLSFITFMHQHFSTLTGLSS